VKKLNSRSVERYIVDLHEGASWGNSNDVVLQGVVRIRDADCTTQCWLLK